jgi:hypothetical protein
VTLVPHAFTAIQSQCHPEQREGSGFLPVPPASLPLAETQIPRFARDDFSARDDIRQFRLSRVKHPPKL